MGCGGNELASAVETIQSCLVGGGQELLGLCLLTTSSTYDSVLISLSSALPSLMRSVDPFLIAHVNASTRKYTSKLMHSQSGQVLLSA